MNTIKLCKVCSKIDNLSKGFCKCHYNAFNKKNIDFDGKPKDGYFYDDNFHLKKIKDTLRQTVTESWWYREWRKEIVKRDNKTCVNCNRNNIKLVVHHEKIRFSTILNNAKNLYSDIVEQLNYCKKQHLLEIGITLCKSCHAEKHKGEKVYSSLSNLRQNDNCLICGELTYCKNFCKYHYGQYKVGVFDKNGNKIRDLKYEIKKNKCILCEKQAKGISGPPKLFCKYHLTQFHNKIIDINGNQIREYKPHIKNKKCKLCEKKHECNDFCTTHNNWYKLGRIDKNGIELRNFHNRREIEFNNKKLSIDDWAKLLGITRKSLDKRLKKWTIERALTTPCPDRYKK